MTDERERHSGKCEELTTTNIHVGRNCKERITVICLAPFSCHISVATEILAYGGENVRGNRNTATCGHKHGGKNHG